MVICFLSTQLSSNRVLVERKRIKACRREPANSSYITKYSFKGSSFLFLRASYLYEKDACKAILFVPFNYNQKSSSESFFKAVSISVRSNSTISRVFMPCVFFFAFSTFFGDAFSYCSIVSRIVQVFV